MTSIPVRAVALFRLNRLEPGSLWRRLGHLRPTPDLSPEQATENLLREAELFALRRAGILRLGVALALLLTMAVVVDQLPGDDPIQRQVAVARVTLVLFGVGGVISWWLASRRKAVRFLPGITATFDAVLVLGNLGYSLHASGVAGDFFSSFPVIFVVPIAMAASAIHYRPLLQGYVAALYLVGLMAILLIAGTLEPTERAAAVAKLALQFGPPPNVVRIVMIVVTALILVLVARQGRTLLERAVRETTLRLTFTRYLPGELAPVLSEDSFAGLRRGRRLEIALLFVDIRGSSALAESIDPARLARFMTAFRRRVSRAAAQHSGIVDKFIGDGALILFGVPVPQGDEAARALACGRTLIRLVERWNAKRGFEPPVRIGIGIHMGEVFCGVVGDESRLEFTVLGEPVNTAARIEQATKDTGDTMLASAEVVSKAGEAEGWEDIADISLRGVTRPVRLVRPRL